MSLALRWKKLAFVVRQHGMNRFQIWTESHLASRGLLIILVVLFLIGRLVSLVRANHQNGDNQQATSGAKPNKEKTKPSTSESPSPFPSPTPNFNPAPSPSANEEKNAPVFRGGEKPGHPPGEQRPGRALVAQISSPQDGDQISPEFVVRGTATGRGFDHYYLEITDQIERVRWIRMGSDHAEPVVQGILEKANLATFKDGHYQLRLVVVGKGGGEKEDANQAVDTVFDLRLSRQGGLKIKVPKHVVMSEITVSTAPQSSTGMIGGKHLKDKIIVSDKRGSFVGWSVTGVFSNFEHQKDETILIPVGERLRVSPFQVITIEGSPEGVEEGKEQVVAGPGEPVMFMRAHLGFGNGVYAQEAGLNMEIPANIVAGKYTSRLVLTVQ